VSDMGGGQIIAGENGQPPVGQLVGQPPEEQDPLQAALAAGGQGDPGSMPDDHDPLMAGNDGGFAPDPVDVDDVEQECLRAMRNAARLAAGATDARQVADAGTGAQAFLNVLETLNADEQQPPAQQVPVMPHAVGMVRHALEADHGIPGSTFDQMLLGAHQHLQDLQTAGDPTLASGAPAPKGPEAGPVQPSEVPETIPGATDGGETA
jgi:hypothetical protein